MYDLLQKEMKFLSRLLIVLATLTVPLSCSAKVLGSCRGSPDLARCTLLQKPFHLDGVCYKEKCMIPDPVQHRYAISVRYSLHSNTSGEQTLREVWLRGSGPGLTWDRPIRMHKFEDEWRFEYTYTSDSFDRTCTRLNHCALIQRAVEFRVYKDEQGRMGMLGPNYYFRLPLSHSTQSSNSPSPLHTIHVYPWFHNKRFHEQYYSFLTYNPVFSRKKGNWRSDEGLKPAAGMGIYYPPSFYENKYRTYPLVLVAGTYTLSTRLSLSYLEYAMVEEGSLEEVVIAVLPPIAYRGTLEECSVSPYENYWFRCKSRGCEDRCLTCADPLRLEPCEPSQFRRQLSSCTGAVPCGQNAEEFLDMIELHVFPLIQEVTQSRVHLDYPRHRATITGYRTGGLFACWAALRRPDLFQNVACLSPSVYLGIREGRPVYELKKEIARTAAKAAGNWPLQLLHSTQNYYIDIGERDSKPFPIYDAYQDTLEVVEDLKHHFHFRLGVNLHFNVFPKYSSAEGQHSSNTIHNDIPYFHRLLYPLLTFFRPIGGGSRDSSRAPKLEELHFAEWEIQLQKKLLPSLSEEASSDDTLDIKLVAVKNTSSTPAPPMGTCNNGAISMPVYLFSLAATVAIVSSVTAALICLRNANKKAGKKQDMDAEEEVEDDSCLDDSM